MSRTLVTGMYATEAPLYLRELLLSRGGTNLHGEPNYRLVRTESRYRLSTGIWKTWDDNLTASERREDRNRPWKTEIETRRVAIYGGEHGWVLERWLPAEAYGTPDTWYAPVEQGGTMRWIEGEWYAACGGYPGRGDYESTGFIFPEWALGSGIIANAVGRIEQMIARITTSKRGRAKEQELIQKEIAEQEDRDYDAWSKEILSDTIGWDARTPGGQAEICRLAESIGIRVHPF